MGYRGKPVARIVVGLDGSKGSQEALSRAIETARPANAEIIAIHVAARLPDLAFPMGMMPYTSQEWIDELKQTLEQKWCAPLREAGVRYTVVFAEGRTAPTVIDVALREGADLIVVGSRGLGGFAELLLGSVSHQLAHHSPIPVVIVPSFRRKRTPEEAQPEAVPALAGAGIVGEPVLS
jgi:nucleotide-binding universal stress UspA family protein